MDNEAMQAKSEALKALGTKEITEKISGAENELERQLKNEVKLKSENAGYLASVGSDCQVVKQKLAELSVQAPTLAADGVKKATVADKDAWLVRQRVENQELVQAISRQADVAFGLESLRVDIEMAKRRLDSLKQVLSLKIAQIEFLTEK